MKATIKWLSKNVPLGKRAFLFCFGKKCMSGKISNFKKSSISEEFEIQVDFIEPSYFQDELVIGGIFTINEAAKILGEGEVAEVV